MPAAPMVPPDRPWISGIRDDAKPDVWTRRVESILTGTFTGEPARGQTAEAETGLAIPPSTYWYVCRTDDRYGYIVFLWREDPDLPLQAADGAVLPFDSGGIWHGRIAMDAPLSLEERQQFVQTHSKPADQWNVGLSEWLSANYADAADYVNGKPPATGVAGIVYDVTRNEAAAWTWEARIDKERYRNQVVLHHVFWRGDDRTAFEDWLMTARHIDERQAEELIRFVDMASIEAPRAERASRAVVRHLLRIVNE
jgi:hypothetical protein